MKYCNNICGENAKILCVIAISLFLFQIGCNSEVDLIMSDELLENYSHLSSLHGKYIITTYNQTINHWVNENDKYSGVWKDVHTKNWCVGFIYVENSEDCGGWNCDCQFRNPSIVSCPHEKMILDWEQISEDNLWENINSKDFQIKPRLGNDSFWL